MFVRRIKPRISAAEARKQKVDFSPVLAFSALHFTTSLLKVPFPFSKLTLLDVLLSRRDWIDQLSNRFQRPQHTTTGISTSGYPQSWQYFASA